MKQDRWGDALATSRERERVSPDMSIITQIQLKDKHHIAHEDTCSYNETWERDVSWYEFHHNNAIKKTNNG